MNWKEKSTKSGLRYATTRLIDSKYFLVARQWHDAVLDSGITIRDTVNIYTKTTDIYIYIYIYMNLEIQNL